MANILVTGVSGFVGKHLVRELRNRGHSVWGVGLSPKAHPDVSHLLSGYSACDLTDRKQVDAIPLESLESIISLAGLAQVGPSFSNPDKYKRINVKVFSVLAERVLREKIPIKMLAISTGALYRPDQPLPITENSLLATKGSPYAQSKILMERKARELRKAGLKCIIARPFNHIGPGQEKGFLVPDLYEKITAAINAGNPLTVGNLKTRRDYTDVRDVARAYADLIDRPKLKYDTYNVCSGRSVIGEEVLSLLADACKAAGRLRIEVDSSLIRPKDPPELYGSHERVTAETGWKPRIDLATTISDFVLAQTKELKKGSLPRGQQF